MTIREFLFSTFIKSAQDAEPSYTGPSFKAENTVVNYVWINAKPFVPSGAGDALCGVPLSALDKAYDNARRYPEAKFIVWIDYSRMDPLSRFWVESHLYSMGSDNVELRDLSLLPAYKKVSDALGPAETSTVKRPDLARLHVMRECLNTLDKEYVMYCDLDAEDARIGCKKSNKILARHGMVHTNVKSLNWPSKDKILGLGYMIFRKDVGTAFLDDLIPIAEKSVIDNTNYGIYFALKEALHIWAEKNPDRKINDVIHPETLLHPIGYDIPDKKIYLETGINF